MIAHFITTWALEGDALSPDLTNEPAPPEGMCRTGVSSYVPAGYTPLVGEPTVVYLSYSELPPPEPEAEPIP
jgi:hypothetical protein